MSRSHVYIGHLKRFAIEKLPKDSILKDLLLMEKEELSSHEFLVKIDLWMKLLSYEGRQ